MAERYIPEHRRTQFKAKNQFKPDELRRRREEQQVEIRKQKREENLAKRRGIQTRDGGIGVGGGNVAATDSDEEGATNESEVSRFSYVFIHFPNHTALILLCLLFYLQISYTVFAVCYVALSLFTFPSLLTLRLGVAYNDLKSL